MLTPTTTLPDRAAAHALLRKRIVRLRPCRDPEPSPISRVLAVMRAADPTIDWLAEMREALAARIERDIAILDALTPDADLEDDADTEDGHDVEDVDLPMRGGCVA